MSTRTMVKSLCGGEFPCKNANKAWNVLEDLSDRTYECETITEALSNTFKIFMDNKGNLPNEFVAFEDTTLCCEYHEIPLFHPP